MDILAQASETTVEGAGELKDGFLAASIKNIGNRQAIVNGVTLEPGEAKGYPFVGKGYRSISYDGQQSTLRIMQIF
jgi:hypothetical protein